MRDYFLMVRAVILVLWPITTWAAGESLGTTLGAVTLADWLSLVILSTVSGLVALLHRVRRSFEAEALRQAGQPAAEADRQLIDWRIFATCHMSGAILVGFIVFALCEALDINNYLEAACIALASWGGAKFADRWADGLSDRISSAIGQKGSTP
ncbi:phage holin family protein [Methylibium petroleiphilum]